MAKSNGLLTGMKFSNSHLSISHLLFVDDSSIFAKASSSQVDTLLTILSQYELLFGDKVNFQKSSIFFSKGISTEVQD